jgi:serine/threonine protein kinase
MVDAVGCLSENQVLAWVAGRLSREQLRTVDEHLDGCDRCQRLMGEALRASARLVPSRARERAFREGDIVALRYRVLRFLASGGMGEVYEVHDTWLNDTIALKSLIGPIADDSSAIARLKAEVLLSRRVSHANVCRVYDLGFHEDPTKTSGHGTHVAFLTMELLRGETLRARLKREGRLDTTSLGAILVQLASGMAHAHSAGIVHRDFKSDNVMLVTDDQLEQPRAVIMDFGLARSALLQLSEPLTSSGHGLVGTLDYMAPEQVEGKAASRQADIYALGVVMFEALTGRLPFDGESAIARALARVRSEPPRPSSIVEGIDARWETAILGCMARDPVDRFQEVGQLLDSLADLIPTKSTRTQTFADAQGAEVGGEAEISRIAGDSDRRARRLRTSAAIGANVIALAAIWWVAPHAKRGATPPAAPRAVHQASQQASGATPPAQAREAVVGVVLGTSPVPSIGFSSRPRIKPPRVTQRPATRLETAAAEPSGAPRPKIDPLADPR